MAHPAQTDFEHCFEIRVERQTSQESCSGLGYYTKENGRVVFQNSSPTLDQFKCWIVKELKQQDKSLDYKYKLGGEYRAKCRCCPFQTRIDLDRYPWSNLILMRFVNNSDRLISELQAEIERQTPHNCAKQYESTMSDLEAQMEYYCKKYENYVLQQRK